MRSEDNLSLLPQHAALVKASAIAPEVAAARGYRSITSRAELARLGFSKAQQNVPCLLIPIYNVHGELATYQIRPDAPRIGTAGKPVKYETPKGSRVVIDVPPMARQCLGDPSRPLFITEGARKADAAVSLKLCCIALLGVWNWRGRNSEDGLTVLPDWEAIALKNRDVYIAFDGDVVIKIEVAAALRRLKEFLASRGAIVQVIRLPRGEGGSKVGLDDFLAAGHDVDDLLALVGELPKLPDGKNDQTYQVTPHGLIYLKPTKEGAVPVNLTNFIARIVTETTIDDGAETTLSFEIDARLHKRTARFTIPARLFPGMNWAVEQLGASAIILPGMGIRDHARAAIQIISENVNRHHVYAHTGWRRVGSKAVYLHSGGAIGVGEPQTDIEVSLPDPLARFTLPPPGGGGALVDAIHATLRVLELTPRRISVPILGATFRAPLGNSDFAIHLSGPTGEGKTALAALAQQHYGPALDAMHLPCSWSSTANALEAIAFAAKDALLVVDDFVPKGGQGDIQRLHREAERLLRAQGNVAGRQRMRPDATLRPTRYPRGLILSTGEEIPRGTSLRARLLILELSPGDLDWELLTSLQKDAADGKLALTMSSYVRWLAARHDEIRARLDADIRELRDGFFREDQHKRTSFVVAQLALGFRYLLDFARHAEAIDEPGRDKLWAAACEALVEALRVQKSYLEAEEPTGRFLELLRAAIASGRGHVADKNGDCPEHPTVWGWRAEGSRWVPLGERVGWVEGDDLFLEPEASYAVAQRQARDGGDALPLQPRTLHRRLADRGLLASKELARQTFTVRRSLAGARRSVLHLRAGSLMRQGPDQPDQADGDEPGPPDAGAGPWSGSGAGRDSELTNDLTRTGAEKVESSKPLAGRLQRGQVGQVPGRTDTRPSGEGSDTRERFEP